MSDSVREEVDSDVAINGNGVGVLTEVKGNVSEEIRKVLEWEVAKSEDIAESSANSKACQGTEGNLDQVVLTGDKDDLTAIYKETGIEIISHAQESNSDASDQDVQPKTEHLQDDVQKDEDDKLNTRSEGLSLAEPEQISQKVDDDDSKIETDGVDKITKSHDDVKETLQTDRQDDRAGDQNLSQTLKSEKERLDRSDSKETNSPFVFPMPTHSSVPKSETSKPKNPLSKLLEPSTRRLEPSTTSQNLSKRSSSSAQSLPSKSRSQNQSTESLNTSRIPRANGHLGRSVSMVTTRVTSPVPSKGDKTPIKKPVQKIPWLIHAQRRPGGLLRRSVSVQVPKKKSTEMAEGMTLVLAVPVTHTTQSVSRSSGDVSQPFIISPYQEEHVLAATCPISGITRHIKIIL